VYGLKLPESRILTGIETVWRWLGKKGRKLRLNVAMYLPNLCSDSMSTVADVDDEADVGDEADVDVDAATAVDGCFDNSVFIFLYQVLGNGKI
jgi:hypothetical protein